MNCDLQRWLVVMNERAVVSVQSLFWWPSALVKQSVADQLLRITDPMFQRLVLLALCVSAVPGYRTTLDLYRRAFKSIQLFIKYVSKIHAASWS